MLVPFKERGKALCIQEGNSFRTKGDLEQLNDLARWANMKNVNELYPFVELSVIMREFTEIVVIYFYELMFMTMCGLIYMLI